MKIVVVNEGAPATKAQVAFDAIYALNDGMFQYMISHWRFINRIFWIVTI